jgi:hypothetical protein
MLVKDFQKKGQKVAHPKRIHVWTDNDRELENIL